MSERQIFIGNLCHVAVDTLRQYCEKYGTITDLAMNREKEDNIYHCFAFLTFLSPRSVTNFMEKRPHQIHDEDVFVKRALTRVVATVPERLIVTNRLVLSDPKKFERRKLRQHFKKFGKIRNFDYENGIIDYDDYDPVDCVLLARPHFIQEREILVTKIIPSESDVQQFANKTMKSKQRSSISSLMTRLKDEEEDLKVKYLCLEKQFEQYKLNKEKELTSLRSELERTKEELMDITQIKLDKLLKNQQLFHEQLCFNLFPTYNTSHSQMCKDFLEVTATKKRKNLRES